MINLVEKDITDQPEDIMQIDQEEILGNKESKDEQPMIKDGQIREEQTNRHDDNNDSVNVV